MEHTKRMVNFIRGCVLAVIGSGMSFATVAAQSWMVAEESGMPEGVTNNAVVEGFVDGIPYVYSFGGIDSTKLYSGIHLRSWRFHTVEEVWEAIPSLPDTLGKIAAGASRVGNIIYIIGGYHVFADGSERSSARVHRYDIEGNSFLPDGRDVPVAIDDHVQAVWRDSLIYIVTGWSNVGNVPNVQVYDPANDRWMEGTEVPDDNVYKSFGASGMIIGDTIYYFGGAAFGSDFPIQNRLRKGAINPEDPTSITWSEEILAPDLNGYRMAATSVGDLAFWLGGSGVTYNYDGVAYNGSGGVEPLGRSLYYDVRTGGWGSDAGNTLPMDLRGIAVTDSTTRYIVGGMTSGQEVSNRMYRLVYTGMVSDVERDCGSRWREGIGGQFIFFY